MKKFQLRRLNKKQRTYKNIKAKVKKMVRRWKIIRFCLWNERQQNTTRTHYRQRQENGLRETKNTLALLCTWSEEKKQNKNPTLPSLSNHSSLIFYSIQSPVQEGRTELATWTHTLVEWTKIYCVSICGKTDQQPLSASFIFSRWSFAFVHLCVAEDCRSFHGDLEIFP